MIPLRRTRVRLLLTVAVLTCWTAAMAEATLTLRARLASGEAAGPLPVQVDVGGERVTLASRDGATLTLPAGHYPLGATLAGATIDGPSDVRLGDGDTATVEFVVHPVVTVATDVASPDSGTAGSAGRASVTVRAATDLPVIVPATLVLHVPDGWRAEGATRIVGGVGGGVEMALEATLLADRPGEARVRADVEPWGATAEAVLSAARQASFALESLAEAMFAAPGGAVEVPVRVSNVGGLMGDVDVGLRGTASWTRVEPIRVGLEPNESRVVVLRFDVPADAVDGVSVRPVLVQDGRTVAESSVDLRVRRPDVRLDTIVTPDVALPGDEVEVAVTVVNEGDADASYTLLASPPEWLEVEDGAVRGQGVLAPGAEARHVVRGRVAFGPATDGTVVVEVRHGEGAVVLSRPVARRVVTIGAPTRDALTVGQAASLTVAVGNPSPRPATLDVAWAAEGARIEGEPVTRVTVPAGASLDVPVTLDAEREGPVRLTVAVRHAGVPAAATLSADVTARAAMEAVRTATVRIPFDVDGADAVWIRHGLPGATVIPGSSRLDGSVVSDPVADVDGRPVWRVAADRGELSFRVRLDGDVTDPPPPEVTARFEGRAVRIAGDLDPRDVPVDASADAAGSAAPSPTGQDVGTPDRLRIVEPVDGTRFRDTDPVRIVVEGPATGSLPWVAVNGAALERSQVGLIRTDTATGVQRVEFYGVDLEGGRNEIEARLDPSGEADRVDVVRAGRPSRLDVTSIDAVANGRTPVRATFVASDANGIATGFGPVTLRTDLEPVAPDAFPDLPGYQVLMRDGYAVAEFRPVVTAGELHVDATFENLNADASVLAVPTRDALYHFRGSATFGVEEGVVYLSGRAAAYAELPTDEGLLQLAIDGAARATTEDGVTTESGLAPSRPDERFPESGAGTEARPTLTSEDAVAFRYTEPGLEVAYTFDDQAAPGAGPGSRLTALAADVTVAETVRVAGFAGLAPASTIEEIVAPDGTRRYELRHVPRAAGETVLIRVQTRAGTVLDERTLVAGRDYVLDTTVGAITLARPLEPSTPDLHDVVLVVRYAPRDAPREQAALGLGVRYDDGRLHAEAGASRVVVGDGPAYRLGGAAGYRTDTFGVEARYLRTAPVSGVARDRFEATLHLQDEGWRVRGSATWESELQADASVAYEPSDGPWSGAARVATDATRGATGDVRVAYDLPGALGVAAAEHERGAAWDVTSLVYEHRIDDLLAGLGLGWDWRSASAEALARGAYGSDAVSVVAEHRQPFSVDRQARSDVTLAVALTPDTDVRASVDAVWGGDVDGRLSLEQRFGPAVVTAGYELPTLGGDGNRLRFGVETPFALTDALSVDVNGAYARSLADGGTRYAAGLAARYAVERFAADAAVDVAVENGAPKLVARASASGRPVDGHSLYASGDYQIVPTASGTFDVGYAYRGASLTALTYHRLVTGDTTSVEGEIAASYRVSDRLQVRPAAAYRVALGDPDGTTVQIGSGATVYPLERLGVGATGTYVVRPADGTGALVLALETSYRVDDAASLAVGYAFGESAGLTPESREGWYVRLDVFGGDR